MTVGFNQTAAVYGRDTGGVYNVLLTSRLNCRLAQVRATSGNTLGRADLQRMRRFLWDPGYAMPAHSQIEVDGERWNVVQGTDNKPHGPSGAVHHRSVDVVLAAAT